MLLIPAPVHLPAQCQSEHIPFASSLEPAIFTSSRSQTSIVSCRIGILRRSTSIPTPEVFRHFPQTTKKFSLLSRCTIPFLARFHAEGTARARNANPGRAALADVPKAIRERVLVILREESGVEVIEDTATLATDLGIDSLSLINVSVRLEEISGQPIEQLEALRTVGDCILAAARDCSARQVKPPNRPPRGSPRERRAPFRSRTDGIWWRRHFGRPCALPRGSCLPTELPHSRRGI